MGEPECSADQDCKENCCVTSPILAVAYFLSFTVIAQFILLNVVIAVLMAQLEESSNDSERRNDEEEESKHKQVDTRSTSRGRPESMGSWTFTDEGRSRLPSPAKSTRSGSHTAEFRGTPGSM